MEARWVYSRQVNPGDPLPHPERSLLEGARQRRIPPGESFVGLVTAVDHRDLQVVAAREGGVGVTVLATVGVDRGSSPRQRDVFDHGRPLGRGPSPAPSPGTVNLVALVDAGLSPGALVRASTMLTEAKTLALVEAGITTREGRQAAGTATDVTVVGHTGSAPGFRYAGSATVVGGWRVRRPTAASKMGWRRIISGGTEDSRGQPDLGARSRTEVPLRWRTPTGGRR